MLCGYLDQCMGFKYPKVTHLIVLPLKSPRNCMGRAHARTKANLRYESPWASHWKRELRTIRISKLDGCNQRICVYTHLPDFPCWHSPTPAFVLRLHGKTIRWVSSSNGICTIQCDVMNFYNTYAVHAFLLGAQVTIRVAKVWAQPCFAVRVQL